MSTVPSLFIKEMLVNGKPTRVECVELHGQAYSLSKGVATTIQLEDEWYEDVADPESVISVLRQSQVPADIFTFWQRLPGTQPLFRFHQEWESIAVLPVTTFDHWMSKQIKPTARNKIRKAQKNGVEVREARYDSDFVRGMTEIFNEAPIRQGRRFWHYGKDFETVKQQFSRFLFRESLLGAYYRDELIGFAMLGNAGGYGFLGQIISKIRHRDKAPNNVLIAGAVDLCGRAKLPYLVYANWGDGSLVDFKRSNGFEETRLPRYYIPLTWRGQLAIRVGLHRGWSHLLPGSIKTRLTFLRARCAAWSLSAKTESGTPK
jgi:hypothetical protein